MDRGQSQVLAVVMLFGLVIVSGTMVVVVGYTALEEVQDQSETEQQITEAQSVSQDITDTIYEEEGTSTETEVESGYEVREGAEIRIEVDGTEIDAGIPNDTTGQLVRDGIVYEGGLVVDENGQIVTRPELDLDRGSTMLQLPVINESRVSRFSGDIQHNGTKTPEITADESVTITIESEYYEQWYELFDEPDIDATVTKNDASETVRLEYDLRDRGPHPVTTALRMGMADGSSFRLNEIPETHIESYDSSGFGRENAVLGTTADSGNNGGDLTVRGNLRSEGDISGFESTANVDVTGDIESYVDIPEPTPTGDLLISPDRARNISDAEQYEAGDGDLEGGLYYTDDDLTIASDVAVTDQTILVVDGDLMIDDSTLEADEAIDIHVNGSLILEDEASVETSDPHEADRVSTFVDEDVYIVGTRSNNPTGPSFTGLIHGTNATVDHIGNFTVYGALTIDGYEMNTTVSQSNSNKNSFTLYYDERLEGGSPYATTNVQSSVLTAFFDSYSGDVHTGDYNDEGDVGDDLLVTGSAELTDSLAQGDLLVEDGAGIARTNVQGDLVVDDELELDDGTYDRDVWVDGDARIVSGANLNRDLNVNGEAFIEDSTVSGDVHVVGTLETDGASNLNGDVHVIGELVAEGGPISGDVYVHGDATVATTINGDLHASGDVSCTGGTVNGDLEVGGTSNGCGSPDGSDPDASQVPPTLRSGPEIIDMPTYQEVTHDFDVRFARVNVE